MWEVFSTNFFLVTLSDIGSLLALSGLNLFWTQFSLDKTFSGIFRNLFFTETLQKFACVKQGYQLALPRTILAELILL